MRGSSEAKVAARVQVRLNRCGSPPEKARVAEGQESLRQVKRDHAEGCKSARRIGEINKRNTGSRSSTPCPFKLAGI